MLAQSAAFGLGGPIAHQSALAALAACANFPPKPNSSLIIPTESTLRRTCGIEMQQVSHLHLSPNVFHGISIPQNQNNNDSQLSTSYIQSQSCTNQTMDISSEKLSTNMK
jgi:hypothetical protein